MADPGFPVGGAEPMSDAVTFGKLVCKNRTSGPWLIGQIHEIRRISWP